MPTLNLLRLCPLRRHVLLLAGLACVPLQAQALDAETLFNWAQSQYPSWFPGTNNPSTQTLAPYAFRHYPGTGNYLGVANGVVYVLGPGTGNQLQSVGNLSDFQCLALPSSCAAPVSDITAGSLHYGRQATFTISGSGLDNDVSVSVTNCSGLALASATTNVRNVTCGVTATGPLTMTAKNASGETLLSRSFNVPEPQVQIQTSLGNIVVELNPGAAPKTVNNFLSYVNSGFYSNTLFHRVIPGFVVQGGGYSSGLTYKTPTYNPIALESNKGLSNLRGSIAMARATAPDTANSQFYFNLVDNTNLDYRSADSPGYAVFGKIVQGLGVMDQMALQATTTTGGAYNVPVTEISILGAQQVQ